jgi:hypothetical protein
VNRRRFLSLLAATAPAALILPELLIPKRSFFLPPAEGWVAPTLGEQWLAWSEEIRPVSVLFTAATSALIRRPEIREWSSEGRVELLVPEEADAELRARMLSAFKEAPRMHPWTMISDLMPWVKHGD